MKSYHVHSNIPYLPGIKNIICVGSGKGGVGKSTVAFHIALELKDRGYNVGILDADIYGPSLPTLTQIHEKAAVDSEKNLLNPHIYRGCPTISLGHLVDPKSAVCWRGPMAAGALMQLFQNVQWGELDFLIVDLPPGTGDLLLTLAQKIPVTAALLVGVNHPLTFADLVRAENFFEKMNIPVLGKVFNMERYTENSNNETDILANIPFDLNIFEATAQGKAVSDLEAQGPAHKAFIQCVDRFLEKLSSQPIRRSISFSLETAGTD
ncbi:MAG: Mrp/NBP35 family ATP-binding protein [Gammaproteobacteria bacterium]|nr:Mrp/NBP35 family ATP-binding protein [Gammaproteobacteria bacterium]